MIESIGVETLSAQSVAVVRGKAQGHEIGDFVGAAYGEVVAVLGAQEAGPTGPPIIIYALGAEGMDESGHAMVFSLAAGFPCAATFTASGRVEAATLPAGDAVVAVHVGAWPEARRGVRRSRGVLRRARALACRRPMGDLPRRP